MDRIKKRAERVPAEVKLMVKMSMGISNRIYSILDSQNKNQKDLAEMLGKTESEISKWLSGTHNFTLKTLAKIELVLGEKINETAIVTHRHEFMFTSKAEESKIYVPVNPENYQDIDEVKGEFVGSLTSSNEVLITEDLLIGEFSEN